MTNMANTNTNNTFSETKPGSRFHIIRDQQRKQAQLSKYLNECQLYKRVNYECKPKRSEMIAEMYEEKKVMKNRANIRKGAKEFNFKKQSANSIINNNKFMNNKEKTTTKGINKMNYKSYSFDDSDQE